MGKLILVLIFCGFVFGTCRKDNPKVCDNSNTILVNQHAKDFFVFKEGSWWVYEEEKTKEIDSIWVGRSTEEKLVPHGQTQRSCKCGYGKCKQEYFVRFMNKYRNNNNNSCLYTYWISTGISEEATGMRSLNCDIIDTFKHFPPSIYQLEYNQLDIPSIYETYYSTISEVDSLIVNGKVYRDILYIKYDHHYHGIEQEAWFARNLHLIKYGFKDSTTWNLIKYNIVK